MKHLHVTRALGFSLLLYIGTSVIFALLSKVFGVNMDANPPIIPLRQCIVYWILLIPLILVLSKWYFRKFQPSTKRGLILGITATVISILLDFVIITRFFSAGLNMDLFLSIYTNWKLYVTTLLIIGTTAYAGFEFDRTYTFEDGVMRKKI